MTDADKQYRAMHPSQAQQFHADDTQTPESRESLTIEQQINRIVIHYTEEHGVGVAATTKDLYPTFTQPMLELVTAAVQQSNRELLAKLKAAYMDEPTVMKGYMALLIKLEDELAALERQQAGEEQL